MNLLKTIRSFINWLRGDSEVEAEELLLFGDATQPNEEFEPKYYDLGFGLLPTIEFSGKLTAEEYEQIKLLEVKPIQKAFSQIQARPDEHEFIL